MRWFVYILRSVSFSEKTYIGRTNDLKRRLRQHNLGESDYTARFRPWRLEVYVGFCEFKMALEFEKYLKTGSGAAFAKKRLIGSPVSTCRVK